MPVKRLGPLRVEKRNNGLLFHNNSSVCLCMAICENLCTQNQASITLILEELRWQGTAQLGIGLKCPPSTHTLTYTHLNVFLQL